MNGKTYWTSDQESRTKIKIDGKFIMYTAYCNGVGYEGFMERGIPSTKRPD